MILYIRKRVKWINFVKDEAELSAMEELLTLGQSILIGDLAVFTKPMMNRLLKLIEENPNIECYSSRDIQDPILLSRFVRIEKEPIKFAEDFNLEEFKKTDRGYPETIQYLSSMSAGLKLRARKSTDRQLHLLLSYND